MKLKTVLLSSVLMLALALTGCSNKSTVSENPEDKKDGFGGKGDFKGDGKREIRDGKGNIDGNMSDIQTENNNDTKDYHQMDGINRNENEGGISLTGTYDTAEDYIKALNAENKWVSYDSGTNTASITSVSDFVCALKFASKDVGAFDALDKSQGENILFGDGDGAGKHFDSVMANLLTGTEYEDEYSSDLRRTDKLGNNVEYRVNMYNPLYYLCDYYDGTGSSSVAKYWRIRSGINQGDTALTTEVNLALALEKQGCEVDFETVWGQAHVEAERTGDSTSNFIEWVNNCVSK